MSAGGDGTAPAVEQRFEPRSIDAERRLHNGPNLTPRAIAKAEIFVEGDHVVYPTHGVGKVERIAIEEIAGHKLELIHITFEENRMTLRVPVAKARTAGLRKLATRKMFDEALAVLRGGRGSSAPCGRAGRRNTRRRSTPAIRWPSPRWCATCTATPASRIRVSPSGRSTRPRWTGWRPNWRALDRIDKAAAAVKLAEFLKTV